MKKTFLTKIRAIVALLAIATSTFAFAACNDKDADVPAPDEATPKTFVKADGIRLLGIDGEPMGLQGTNLGGWLVQEEWLCPSTMSYSYAQIDILLTLYNRFGKEEADRLMKVYEDNWVTEQDFANIKALGMNCVRIPFTYLNFMDPLKYDEEKGEWVKKDWSELTINVENNDGFARLDWALETCKKYGLYAILDMHGAVGSQSGQDHSGDISEYLGRLYLQDEVGATCREKTIELWVEIAKRYKDNEYVAALDILNEPGIATGSPSEGKNQTTANDIVMGFFDDVYKAIREVDQNHVICFESCWQPTELAFPDKYGWENVLYQYHHYNWASTNMPNDLYYDWNVQLTDGKRNGAKRNFPVLIGEFNVWPDTHADKTQINKDSTQTEAEAWSGVMELYTSKGWSYTTWNFKHCATHSSWGLFNLKEGIDNPQADLLKSSIEEIEYAWSYHNASNYRENTDLTNCIKPYMDSFYTGAKIKPLNEKYYILGTVVEEE